MCDKISHSIFEGSCHLSTDTSSTRQVLHFLNQNILVLSNDEDNIGWLSPNGVFTYKKCCNFLRELISILPWYSRLV